MRALWSSPICSLPCRHANALPPKATRRIYGITVDDPICAPDAPTPDPSRMIDR
jgi:hypothetical protein